MSLAKNLRKTVEKSSSVTLASGFYEDEARELWVSSGNYAMNRLLSGNFYRGIPFSKTTVIAGESGSGKSLVAAISAANAQREHNSLVVWLDSEFATKRVWLEALGVDTSDERFVYLNVGTIEDVKKVVADIVKEVDKTKPEERTPVFIVVDSYSMLLTSKELEEAQKGDVVGDQGQHAKQVKNLIKAVTTLIGRLPIAVLGMAHSMASNDKYNPDDVITGGRGIQYAASLILVFNKTKLKVDQLEDGEFMDEFDDNKKVVGIKSKASVVKSRFAKPNEKVMVQIPYPNGLDPYSGLFDHLLEETNEIYVTSVGWYAYSTKEGGEVKFRKKDFRTHADAIMKAITDDTLVMKAATTSRGGPKSQAESEAA